MNNRNGYSDIETYCNFSTCITDFSDRLLVKRKFGKTLRARKFCNQVKEIKLKLIVYNISKKVNLHQNKDFYRAEGWTIYQLDCCWKEFLSLVNYRT
jgi:hypothetical protein